MGLYAERIAIEVKTHFEVYNYGHSRFKSYLVTANGTLNYTEIEKLRILELAEKILVEKYNIKILSTDPFVIAKD